jgi:MFS family permease
MNFTALAGCLSLAVAMGIGRFAFTPVLPLMLHEGALDVAAGGWVAAANYAGYLAGALTAARVHLRAGTLGIVALVATAALTAAMVLPGVGLWVVLRFAAGVASAWAFVSTSVWCLGALAQQGRGALGGFVYSGVGVGISVAGLYCLAATARGVGASALWVQLGGLAFLLAVPAMAGARASNGGVPVGDRRPTEEKSNAGLVIA